MPARTRVTVNGNVLKWSRQVAGFTLDSAAQRLNVRPERLEEWESGQTGMTINQIQNAAALYRRTPASFFLPAVPKDDPAEATSDYRGGDGTRGPALSRELLLAARRREHFMATTDDDSAERRVPSLPAETPLHAFADQVRELLGVTLADQTGFPSASVALTTWIQAFADAFGVLVFQMSRVPIGECRAFSVYHDRNAYIVLNGADPVEARIFSLFHELGHLILRSGGICSVYSDNRVERSCNRFAAEFLIPKAVMYNLGEPLSRIPELARFLKVSQSAVAVRMRDLNLITQEQLDGVLAEAARVAEELRERQRSRASKGGPPHHQIVLRNVGTWYASTIIDAMNREVISPMDASYFLQSKLKTIDRMQQDLAARVDLSAAEAEVS